MRNEFRKLVPRWMVVNLDIQEQGHNIFASAEGSPVKDFQVFLEIFSYNLYHALTKGENLPWGIGWQNIGLMSEDPSMPERMWTNTFVSHLKRRNKIVPNQVWKIGNASTPIFFHEVRTSNIKTLK